FGATRNTDAPAGGWEGRRLGDAAITAQPVLYRAGGTRGCAHVSACYHLNAESETPPAARSAPAPSSAEKPPPPPPATKRGKKPGPGAVREPRRCSVSRLIPEAWSSSLERADTSLAALKKALAAGYDVDKNNSRIKLGLKSLVSKGTLVQTKGTGAAGSFKLNKTVAPEAPKRQRASSEAKKLALAKGSRSPKSPKTKAFKKPRATAKRAARGREKAKAAKAMQPRNSPEPAKASAASPKVGRPRLGLQKTNPWKAAKK
ncbi:histone H1t-like, partial [Nannospalax galili]